MAINRRLLFVLTGWAAVSLLFAAWLTFSWGGIESTQRFDDLGEFVIAFIAAGLAGANDPRWAPDCRLTPDRQLGNRAGHGLSRWVGQHLGPTDQPCLPHQRRRDRHHDHHPGGPRPQDRATAPLLACRWIAGQSPRR